MKPNKPVNVRRSDVMEKVSAVIGEHYLSPLVDGIRARGGRMVLDNMTILLAQEFGFCAGVRRAIDIAYAARRVFPDQRIYLIGEIIHNPEVNRQLDEMGLVRLPWQQMDESYEALTPDDVVIIPAFGVPVQMREFLEEKGVSIVDTTCGDVMKVWRRVKGYANSGITSVIHGKAKHEESRATASHARGDGGEGHYIVVFTSEDARVVCDYILGKGDREKFLAHFRGAMSEGFDPDLHLQRVGMANQTTMLKEETLEIQTMLRDAVIARDGNELNFHVFDTICGATQDRQNALFHLLEQPLDAVIVVGGYNSSNTTHLVEIAQKHQPNTWFVENAACIESLHEIRAFNTRTKKEELTALPPEAANISRRWTVGITAGASCPANLIEEVIRRFAALRGCAVEVK